MEGVDDTLGYGGSTARDDARDEAEMADERAREPGLFALTGMVLGVLAGVAFVVLAYGFGH